MERITLTKMGLLTGADVAINQTANIWTRSVKIAWASAFCIAFRAKADSGTPDLDIYLEQTHIDPLSIATGELVIGDVYNGWKIPQSASKLMDITDEAWHYFTISPVAIPYLRLLVDGQGSNPATCTAEIYISKQELLGR